jgi:hypothetical protein
MGLKLYSEMGDGLNSIQKKRKYIKRDKEERL